MKEILGMVAVVVVIATVLGIRDSTFKATCRAQGGNPVQVQYNQICFTKGAVIDNP